MRDELEPKFILLRFAAVLAPVVIGVLAWSVYRDHVSDQVSNHAAAISTSTKISTKNPEKITVPSPAQAPASSPISRPQEAKKPRVKADARTLRTIMDHGLELYSLGRNDKEKLKGAQLVQGAALLGYGPARELIARNYPRSGMVRAAAAPTDAVHDALEMLGASSNVDDSKAVFAALAEYFAGHGQMDAFLTYLIAAIRDYRDLQSGASLDRAGEVLAQVSGACEAMAQFKSTAASGDGSNCRTWLKDNAATSTGSVDGESDAQQRALLLLEQVGEIENIR